jgi:hypothetical protein
LLLLLLPAMSSSAASPAMSEMARLEAAVTKLEAELDLAEKAGKEDATLNSLRIAIAAKEQLLVQARQTASGAGQHHASRSAVTVQLYDTSHTSRITPGDSYAKFREQVQRTFGRYLQDAGGAQLSFTLHHYPVEDDPLSKVKLDDDDPAVSARRWAEYLQHYSETTIVLFTFSAGSPAKRSSPLRDRMPDGLRISVAPLKSPSLNSATSSGTERVSPTLSGKAKERDGKVCVMCNALPVQPYGAHIIPHGDERWCQAAGLLVPSALAWFVEQPINIVTLCDDCHKLFDEKAALWVEVDAAATDPARRLKITLHDRVPECSDELLARCRARFPPDTPCFVRVPSGQRERDSFPCWSSYDALWCYRLRWSQAKHAHLCQVEDDTRQRDALRASWDGNCAHCGKKGNAACTRSFSCKKCCSNAGGCAPAQHPDTRDKRASAAGVAAAFLAAAAAGAGDAGSSVLAAAMRGLRTGE